MISFNDDNKDKDINNIIYKTKAPKRLSELPCNIYFVNIEGTSYIVLIGLLKENSYEIFCGTINKSEWDNVTSEGRLLKIIHKNDSATYNLIACDKDGAEIIYNNIVKLFDNPNYGVLTRMLSTSL